MNKYCTAQVPVTKSKQLLSIDWVCEILDNCKYPYN
jgi:hypothetical protein